MNPLNNDGLTPEAREVARELFNNEPPDWEGIMRDHFGPIPGPPRPPLDRPDPPGCAGLLAVMLVWLILLGLTAAGLLLTIGGLARLWEWAL